MKSLLPQQLLQLAFLNTFSADSEYQSEYPIRFLIWYPIRHYYRKIRNSKKLLFGGPAHNFRVSYLRSTFMNHMHLHTMELLGWIIFFVLKTVIVHGTEFPPWTSFNIQLSCVDSQFLHVIKRSNFLKKRQQIIETTFSKLKRERRLREIILNSF